VYNQWPCTVHSERNAFCYCHAKANSTIDLCRAAGLSYAVDKDVHAGVVCLAFGTKYNFERASELT